MLKGRLGSTMVRNRQTDASPSPVARRVRRMQRSALPGGFLPAPPTDGTWTLMDTMPCGVIVESPEGLVQYANARACAILELPADEVVGKPITELPLRAFLESSGHPVSPGRRDRAPHRPPPAGPRQAGHTAGPGSGGISRANASETLKRLWVGFPQC